MQTYPAKRVEIIIEKVMERTLSRTLDKVGLKGYTVLSVRGGNGASGPWTREGEIAPAGGMVAFICLVSEDGVDALLDAAFAVVERHIGVVSVTDAQVMRPSRF